MTEVSDDSTENLVIEFPSVAVIPNSDSAIEDWQYSDRQHPQQILDYLWLGPVSALRDTQFLVANNIRVLISLLDPRLNHIVSKRCDEANIPLKQVFIHNEPVSSRNGQLNMSSFEQVVEEVELARSQGVSTYIFCETGNEKSATAVAAYLIYSQNTDHMNAVKSIIGRRYSVFVNSESMYYLQTFESMCKAKRMSSSNVSQVKRQLEPDDPSTINLSSSTEGPKKRAH